MAGRRASRQAGRPVSIGILPGSRLFDGSRMLLMPGRKCADFDRSEYERPLI